MTKFIRGMLAVAFLANQVSSRDGGGHTGDRLPSPVPPPRQDAIKAPRPADPPQKGPGDGGNRQRTTASPSTPGTGTTKAGRSTESPRRSDSRPPRGSNSPMSSHPHNERKSTSTPTTSTATNSNTDTFTSQPDTTSTTTNGITGTIMSI